MLLITKITQNQNLHSPQYPGPNSPVPLLISFSPRILPGNTSWKCFCSVVVVILPLFIKSSSWMMMLLGLWLSICYFTYSAWSQLDDFVHPHSLNSLNHISHHRSDSQSHRFAILTRTASPGGWSMHLGRSLNVCFFIRFSISQLYPCHAFEEFCR